MNPFATPGCAAHGAGGEFGIKFAGSCSTSAARPSHRLLPACLPLSRWLEHYCGVVLRTWTQGNENAAGRRPSELPATGPDRLPTVRLHGRPAIRLHGRPAIRLHGRPAIRLRGRRLAAAATAAAALATIAGCASPSPAAAPPSSPSATHQPAGSGQQPSRGNAGDDATTHPASASRLLTSCRSVVHIGDSTSDGLVLPAYQPDPALRIRAQYRRVGVTTFIPQVSGARSIVETWHGFPNAYTVAQRELRRGYNGCWVLALGTNDTADVAVGSSIGLSARIQAMMSLIGTQPVMWVNVISLLSSGPYAESRMRMWNRALLQACTKYPNMRVYNWAAAARSGWFIPDGIHYTPQGYAKRSRLIANALALAFPAVQPELSMSTSIRPGWAVSGDSCLVN
jgi:hypothetical protein